MDAIHFAVDRRKIKRAEVRREVEREVDGAVDVWLPTAQLIVAPLLSRSRK